MCFGMVTMADLREHRRAPPFGPKCSQLHAVFRKIWQNRMLAPPPPHRGVLVPPSTGNPGSAPGQAYDMNCSHVYRKS